MTQQQTKKKSNLIKISDEIFERMKKMESIVEKKKENVSISFVLKVKHNNHKSF
jgi:hypothetical protein